MVRIFLSLSIFALLMTALTMVVGLALGDLKQQLVLARDTKLELVGVQKQLRAGGGDRAELEKRELLLRAEVEELDGVVGYATMHRLLGIATALVIVFVNSVSVTYFIGTARWIREVCETYPIDKTSITKSRKIKSTSFPWSAVGIAAALAISALGAASDPSSGNVDTERFVDWHLAAALGGTVLVAFAFYRQWLKIGENNVLIEHVLEEVKQVREQRKLPTG